MNASEDSDRAEAPENRLPSSSSPSMKKERARKKRLPLNPLEEEEGSHGPTEKNTHSMRKVRARFIEEKSWSRKGDRQEEAMASR